MLGLNTLLLLPFHPNTQTIGERGGGRHVQILAETTARMAHCALVGPTLGCALNSGIVTKLPKRAGRHQPRDVLSRAFGKCGAKIVVKLRHQTAIGCAH